MLNADASLRWFHALDYTPQEVGTLSGTAVDPGAVLVAGRHDQDGDGWDDVGYASLYAPVGNLLSQALLTSDSSSVWAVGARPVSDSTLIVCGGEHRAGSSIRSWPVLHLRAPGLTSRSTRR